MKIAIAGTDSGFSRNLALILEGQGYRVSLFSNLKQVPESINGVPVELVVIHGAHSRSGIKGLLADFRRSAPLARTSVLAVCPDMGFEESARILDSGADDCLSKPFKEAVFTARVRALLRRRIWSGLTQTAGVQLKTIGPLELNVIERQARLSGKPVALTRLEFELLSYFIDHSGEALSRETILKAIWKYPADVETRTLDKHVETLRKKLGKWSNLIQTVHGIGYRLAE